MAGELGKLTKLDPREIWKDEAREFTPWLAKPENLQELSNTIKMDLEFIEIEKRVGPYKADIFVRDLNTEKFVIIENYLEKSNHDHLGKTITYASGLGASTVVWICKEFTDEHRQAIEWLNENTDEGVNFFALEIELWRISNSPPAPKFNIVASPNEWAKVARETTTGSTNLSETKLLQKEFWSQLRDWLSEKKSFLRPQSPAPQHWYNFAIGRSGFHIALTVNTRDSRLGCELYISHPEKAKQVFHLLLTEKEAIEKELGENLDWQELPEGRDSRIVLYKEGNIKDRSRWGGYTFWFGETAEKFHKVFSDRVKKLRLE